MSKAPDNTLDATTNTKWIWNGLLERGTLTLLSSRTPTDKSRLVHCLAAASGDGGSLAGRAVAPVRSMLLSNLWADQWRRSLACHPLPPDALIACHPFCGRPSGDDWPDQIEEMMEVRPGLVVIDPFEAFVSYEAMSNAVALETMIRQLRPLVVGGTTVLLVHRQRSVNESGRHLANIDPVITNNVDRILRLERLPGTGTDDPRRTLRLGRRQKGITIRPTAGGRDYEVCPEPPDEFESAWPFLESAVRTAGTTAGRKTLLAAWPPKDKPSPRTLAHWLDRAVGEGRLKVRGTGRRGDALRYDVIC